MPRQLRIDYRNRRMGEFLKQLSLTEGRGTGVPKMLEALRANGSVRWQVGSLPDHINLSAKSPASGTSIFSREICNNFPANLNI